MKKTIWTATSIILIAVLFLTNCKSNSDDENPEEEIPIYTLELRHNVSGDRITFSQISLPGYVFTVNSKQQSFTLDEGMPEGVNDIRISLTYNCSVGDRTITSSVTANFFEDKKTVIEINRIVTCGPEFVILYE